MTEHETLTRAADKLEELAAKATPGPWTTGNRRALEDIDGREFGNEADVMTLDERYVTASGGGSPEPCCEEDDARWMATVSPDRAAPLVAWLRFESRFVRRNAEYMGGTESDLPSVQFARLVLGEDS